MLEQGYWIMPNAVLYSKELTDKQKLLFCLISSLCAEKGYCRATSEYIAEKLWTTARTVREHVSELQEKWFITVEIKNGNERIIRLCEREEENFLGVGRNLPRGEEENFLPYIYMNNTNMNNTKENISSKEEIETSSITKDINNLIDELKQECDNLGIAYDKTKERQFSKHILSAKEYGGFCEKVGMSRVLFAINILKASVVINFWKWACSWPMKIYQNYADVYNKTKELHTKNQKNLIQSF